MTASPPLPPSEPRLSRARRRIFWALTILLGFVAPILLAEAFLRWRLGAGLDEHELKRRLEQSNQATLAEGGRLSLFGLVRASEHSDVVYELKPGLIGTFRERSLRVNAHGLRGPERSLEKPPGVRRIVGLGDSVMFGWGVDEGETYLEVLEQKLNRDAGGERFEVLNCAVPGYNTTMEVAIYEARCAAFDPDLIVIHFVVNDFKLPHFLQPPRGGNPSRWYLASLVEAALGGNEPSSPESAELLPHDRRHLPEDLRRESTQQYEHMVGVKAYESAMRRLAELAERTGTPVIVLTAQKPHAAVDRAAAEHGFTRLNAAPRFLAYLEAQGLDYSEAVWRKTFQLRGDSHPNPLGHRLFAELLYDELAQSDFFEEP